MHVLPLLFEQCDREGEPIAQSFDALASQTGTRQRHDHTQIPRALHQRRAE